MLDCNISAIVKGRLFLLACSIAAALALTACDSALPDDPPLTLVVEGFIDTGKPMPAIRLSRTTSVSAPYDPRAAAIDDAAVSVSMGSHIFDYAVDPGRPGVYRPVSESGTVAEAGESFALDVRWDGDRASTGGIIPPSIHLRSVGVVVPDEPVSAVLLDSLMLSDSLALGAYEGFIYPIEVSVTWDASADQPDESWIRAQLRPYSDFSSPVVDLFLQSEAIFREGDADSTSDDARTRTWTGVYAVGVGAADAPLPEHALRVAVIRSGRDYARYASTLGTPERREPLSNLTGAVGIFAAISVDSTRVQVGPER